MEIKNM